MFDIETIKADFVDAMRSAGVNIDTGSPGGPHPVADGKWHRADALGKKKKRNQHVRYFLHTDGIPAGFFTDVQAGVDDSWCAKKPSTMTKEERDSLRVATEKAKLLRAEERAKEVEVAGSNATTIWRAAVKATPDHGYLTKKGLPVLPGLKVLTTPVKYSCHGDPEVKTAPAGLLVVPAFSAAGVLMGVQMIREDGQKRFLKGMAKEGSYHPIGKAPAEGNAVILISEGYATAARLHLATGHLSIAAWDSGNLGAVSLAIRGKYPEARIIICADNDRMTVKPIENPGLTKAREAAEKIGATVCFPVFPDGDIVSTDFDDLAQASGLPAVAAIVADALNPRTEEPPPHDASDFRDEAPDFGGDPGSGDAAIDDERGDEADIHLADFGSPHFKCLGVDGTTCYFQPAKVAQIIDLPAAAMKGANMLRLAPLQFWEREFPGKKEGCDWNAAVNACMQACLSKRKFVPLNKVRGRGAWFEGDTAVYNAGDVLIVNGKPTKIDAHDSKFIYEEGERIEFATRDPATTEESRRLLHLCKSLRWQSPLSGYLLAGWCVVAPVCGFLRWRPHIWVNGPAGSGKSTVMDRIVKAALGSTSHSVVGNTSEAGIRSALGMDAMPVIFDESEPRDMASQQRIKSILDLARVAASESEATILKGTANQKTKGFRARSMFVFASINTQIEGFADESRFTQLTLVKPEYDGDEEKAEGRKHYEKLVSDIIALLTPAFAKRLLARTIQCLPVLKEYVEVFTAAATIHLGDQRLGDQIGPMLAGAYLLNSTGKVTVETALAWIRKNDWTEHTAKDSARDTERFIQHITGTMLRHQTPEGGTWERSIGELLDIAAYESEFEPDEGNMVSMKKSRKKESAIAALAYRGIRVFDAGSLNMFVEVSSTHENFRKLLKGTEWAGTKWRKILETIPGSYSGKGNRYFMSGVNSPFMVVPLDKLRGDG